MSHNPAHISAQTRCYRAVTLQHLNRESAVGVEHFGLCFRKHPFQPLLHHLREAAGPRVIARSHELKH